MSNPPIFTLKLGPTDRLDQIDPRIHFFGPKYWQDPIPGWDFLEIFYDGPSRSSDLSNAFRSEG